MANSIPFSERITVTVDEAVTGTGIGRSKLYELIRAGTIESTTVGTRRLIYVRSILSLLGQTKASAA